MTRGDAVVTLGLAAVGLTLSLAAGWSLRRSASAVDAMASASVSPSGGGGVFDRPQRWILAWPKPS